MKPSRMIESFTNKYPFVGPAFWIASLQYYLVQIVVAMAWATPYSWRFNTISDLGNTVCGFYNGRYVCSPRHDLMNFSFLILGVTMIIGAVLIYQEFKETYGSAIGFTSMAIAGFGSALVGLFPENTNHFFHILGAFLPFLIGNIGLLILGSVLDISQKLRVYTIFSGLIGLLGVTFFTFGFYFGLGIGGMERVAAYPQTMWLIVFGIYMSRSHMRQTKS